MKLFRACSPTWEADYIISLKAHTLATIDHVNPRSVCPDLGNELFNLEPGRIR